MALFSLLVLRLHSVVRVCNPVILVTDAMLQEYRDDNPASPLLTIPPEQWSVGHVTDFSSLFKDSTLNPNVEHWDVSSGHTFENMFENAVNFNRPLATWDFRSATNLDDMLHGATAFNQTLHINAKNANTFNRLLKNAVSMEADVTVFGKYDSMECEEMLSGATLFNGKLLLSPLSRMATVKNILDGAVKFAQQLRWDNLPATCNVENALRGTLSVVQHSADCWGAPYDGGCDAIGTAGECGLCTVGIPSDVAHNGAVALIITTVLVATAGALNVLSALVFGRKASE